ncbi:hypothetical protein NQ176_g4287 [Zarea fungicola]|uniref:Uncharacterized protein n=1 Tax=Zarea fungicola TaxID=93591 RepID=A0ACC1NF47_9HYPO|nr:hypothetical protein NQ176_g4287 [Lecanicillium fungicola]
MCPDSQGKQEQTEKFGQGQQGQEKSTNNQKQPAASTETLQSRAANNITTMPKSSSAMAPQSLPLHLRSQHDGTRQGRDSSLQLDCADLIAVGAWADPQMGGVGPDHGLDSHLRSAGGRQSSARK